METFSALLAMCAENSPITVNSPQKGQWHGSLVFSLICAWINGWVNNGEAGDLRRHRTHYDVIVMGFHGSHVESMHGPMFIFCFLFSVLTRKCYIFNWRCLYQYEFEFEIIVWFMWLLFHSITDPFYYMCQIFPISDYVEPAIHIYYYTQPGPSARGRLSPELRNVYSFPGQPPSRRHIPAPSV